MNSHLLTAKDIAKTMHVSIRSAYRVMNEKGFPLIRIGNTHRVKSDEFLKWLETKKVS
jgi:excisionase family DNA binding protein